MSELLPIFGLQEADTKVLTGGRYLMAANDPIDLIASLAKAVQDNPNPYQLTSHIALKTLSALDCRSVAIGIIQREGFLDLIGNYGLGEDTVSPFTRMPLWTLNPMTDAARTGEFVHVNSTQEMHSRYPVMASVKERPSEITVAAPIKFRNITIGSIAFGVIKPPPSGYETHPLTEALLAITGLYLRSYSEHKVENGRNHAEAAKTLTARQKQIIKLFIEDLTTDQMADRLRYSPSTIKQDIIKIYDIFGVSSRSEVVKLAEQAGILGDTAKS